MNQPSASIERSLGIIGSLNATSVAIGDMMIPGALVEKTLQKYCKQVFILTGSEQFPYQFFGSSTAIGVDGRHFLMCCGHQIDHFKPDNVAVYHRPTNEVFTGSRLLKPTINNDNREGDITDVRALEFVIANYRIAHLCHQFFRIDRDYNVWPQYFDTHFIVYGYPSERQDVDYSIPHITARATQVIATYDGPSNSPQVHRIRMDRKEIFDADGMSGGAVFYIGKRGIANYFIGLAGIVIRGGKSSDFLHFVESKFLLEFARSS